MEGVNIAEATQKEGIPTSMNLTQEAMHLHNVLTLPSLLVRLTQGKELLMDYSRSHVATSIEYLGVL